MGAESDELPLVLRKAFRLGQVWDDAGRKIALDSNVSPGEAWELHRAVRTVRPQRSVEVGLAKGVSTLAILGALEQNGSGRHAVIDPFQANYGNAGIEMVRRAGLESWWEFHRKFPEEVIPGLDPIQFAFIDGSHLFDLTLMEFVLVDKKLDVGGVVAFHDMWMPSLQKCVRYIRNNRDYEVWTAAEKAAPVTQPRPRTSLKSLVRRLVSRLPSADSVFAPEFLQAQASLGYGNLLFLRKRGPDQRTWTQHSAF